MSEFEERSEALIAATARRVELKTAVSRVELSAAAPSALPSWRDDIVRELDDLRIALDQHVSEVEGPDGLLAELGEAAPRLINKIDRVRDEHPDLCRQCGNTIELAKQTSEVSQLRSSVLELLVAIARHRQHGADLVYEGYNVDIGGG
jgi:hypothetical protein